MRKTWGRETPEAPAWRPSLAVMGQDQTSRLGSHCSQPFLPNSRPVLLALSKPMVATEPRLGTAGPQTTPGAPGRVRMPPPSAVPSLGIPASRPGLHPSRPHTPCGQNHHGS